MGQKQTHQFLHRRGDSCSPLCAAEGLSHYCILQFGPTRKTLTNWKESSSDHWVVMRLQHRVHEETLRELGFSSLEKGQLGSSHTGHPLPEWRSWKKQRQTLPEADKDRTWENKKCCRMGHSTWAWNSSSTEGGTTQRRGLYLRRYAELNMVKHNLI